MLLIGCLFLRENIKVSTLLAFVPQKPDASPEDTKTAREIARFLRTNKTKCYRDLGGSLRDLCVNLDTARRVHLAISLMICQQDRDGRAPTLPAYFTSHPTDFTSSLPPNDFIIYTALFTNLDSICFHAMGEAQSHANLDAIDRVFQASTIAQHYLQESKHVLENITKSVITQLNDVRDDVTRQTERIKVMHDRLMRMIQQFNEIIDTAKRYRGSVVNLKIYLIGLAAAVMLSLIVPNVFIPTLSVTGIFLIVDSTVALPGGAIIAVTYTITCFVILVSAISSRRRRQKHTHSD
jgi:hypothetical protein